MPGELVHRAAPDDGLLAAVAQHHDEGVERGRPVGVAEIDPAELAPVALGLGPRRRLDPAERPHRRACRNGLAHICAPTCTSRRSRARRGGSRGGVWTLGGRSWPRTSAWACHQWATASVQAELLDPRRLLPAIGGPLAGAAEMIPDRPLGDAEDPRRLGLRLASLLQDLDRHDLLPCELGQGGASQRALDVQDQLGSAWLACRWMSSTTPVLNLCQARNDSGSLTPSLTGLVTRDGDAERPLPMTTRIDPRDVGDVVEKSWRSGLCEGKSRGNRGSLGERP